MKSLAAERSRLGSCRHVIAGLGAESGGPSYSVPALARASVPFFDQLTIYTLRQASENTVLNDKSIRIDRFDASKMPLLSSLRGSASLNRAVGQSITAGDVIHNHGLWLLPNLYSAWQFKKRQGSAAKIVHSPRGMLGAAARRISAWKKEPIWWLWQKDALQTAHCLHATAPSEYEEIRQSGLTNPVAIIPNGIDIPHLPVTVRNKRAQKVILSLGRIHPKKGLDRLLRAWSNLESRFPDWSLRLVGNTEVGHDAELMALSKQLQVARFEIQDAAYGDAKWLAYQSADLFVLPTLNENFGITVAEALACELPVISTKGAPWQGLVHEGCGWWIEHGVEPLTAALEEAMQMTAENRAEMGLRGKNWMAKDFGWPAIGAEMAHVYRWLQGGGPMPASVRLT